MKLEHMTINDLREIKEMLDSLREVIHERFASAPDVVDKMELIDKEIAAHNRRTIIGD